MGAPVGPTPTPTPQVPQLPGPGGGGAGLPAGSGPTPGPTGGPTPTPQPGQAPGATSQFVDFFTLENAGPSSSWEEGMLLYDPTLSNIFTVELEETSVFGGLLDKPVFNPVPVSESEYDRIIASLGGPMAGSQAADPIGLLSELSKLYAVRVDAQRMNVEAAESQFNRWSSIIETRQVEESTNITNAQETFRLQQDADQQRLDALEATEIGTRDRALRTREEQGRNARAFVQDVLPNVIPGATSITLPFFDEPLPLSQFNFQDVFGDANSLPQPVSPDLRNFQPGNVPAGGFGELTPTDFSQAPTIPEFNLPDDTVNQDLLNSIIGSQGLPTPGAGPVASSATSGPPGPPPIDPVTGQQMIWDPAVGRWVVPNTPTRPIDGPVTLQSPQSLPTPPPSPFFSHGQVPQLQ